MKKQNLKVLKLNKKAISTLATASIKGRGYSHSNMQNGTREHCCYPL
jgi:hypothetical protein